ncbi:hypothetical protein Ancab_018475 [Ancistrocladus abbreviatus]
MMILLSSTSQRAAAEAAEEAISKDIAAELDIKQITSEAFRIADFGCSTGPNTFLQMQALMQAVELKFTSQGLDSRMPEFQVFFNDTFTNDFNSLFVSLPQDRRYYAAGVPGSFHGPLFLRSSIHIAHCSSALHWLSKVPSEVADRASPAWNEGKIHGIGCRKEVREAYFAQFVRDMLSFLCSRAQELVDGGIMVLLIPAAPDFVLDLQTTIGSEFDLLASCLMDMARIGKVSEAKVESFNLPVHYPTPGEVKELLTEGKKYFNILRVEELKVPKKNVLMPDPKKRSLYLRAALEELINRHFGSEIIDELFERFSNKLAESSAFLNAENHVSLVLYVFLKRRAA